jgi:membrane protein
MFPAHEHAELKEKNAVRESLVMTNDASSQSIEVALTSRPRGTWVDAMNLWLDTECLSRGAAVSFYTATTLVPICGVVIGIMAIWFGQDAAVEHFAHELARLLGSSATAAVTAIAAQARSGPSSGWPAAIGIGLMIFGATSVMAELRAAFAAIWRHAGAMPHTERAFANTTSLTLRATLKATLTATWQFLRTRVLALTTMVALTFILLASTLLTTIAGLVVDSALQWSGQRSTVVAALSVQTIGFITSTLVTWVAMLAMFRMLLPVRLTRKLLTQTSIIATVLFIVGRLAIGFYIANAPQLDSYGAAASLVVLMLWLYYAAQVVLLSACLAAVKMRGPQMVDLTAKR